MQRDYTNSNKSKVKVVDAFSIASELNIINPDLESLKNSFNKEGTCIVPASLCPLSASQWKYLDKLTDCLSYKEERSVFASFKESTVVAQGKLKVPEVGAEECKKIKRMLTGPKIWSLFESLTLSKLSPHQMHSLKMIEGDKVFRHSHKAMGLSVVFHLSKDYGGGVYRDYPDDKNHREYIIPANSIFISKGDLTHEVTPVTKGVRKTFVIFCSD